MAKFKVWASVCYEIEVEAESFEQAEKAALDIPLEDWRNDYEMEVGSEQIDEAA